MLGPATRMVAVALLCDITAPAEQIDWTKFFQDVLSRDQGVQSAAREKGLGSIVPQLCSESAEKAIPDIQGLAAQLNRKIADTDVQASAFLVTIARFRNDSALTLAGAVPALLDHVHDPTAQVRQNSVDALSVLKPDLSVTLLPVFVGLADGQDPVVQPGAIFAIARLSGKSVEAQQTLIRLLTDERSTNKRSLTVRAIPAAGVTDAPVLVTLGVLLSAKDGAITRAALSALNRCGKRAIDLNYNQIAQFAETAGDKELVTLARTLLSEER